MGTGTWVGLHTRIDCASTKCSTERIVSRTDCIGTFLKHKCKRNKEKFRKWSQTLKKGLF